MTATLNNPVGQRNVVEHHWYDADGAKTSPPATVVATPMAGMPEENQTSQVDHRSYDDQSTHVGLGPILRNGALRMCADVVDDLERTRDANDNRLRQLTRTEADKDGHVRGQGMSIDEAIMLVAMGSTDDFAVSLIRLQELNIQVSALYDEAVKNLQRVMRGHPLWKAWGKGARGVGEKQLARLLASIGDPYWNDLHQRPRTRNELWSFSGYSVINSSVGHQPNDTHTSVASGTNVHPADQCGVDTQTSRVGGVAQRRVKGQKSNWSSEAKMRAFLVAQSCVKQPAGTRYRDVYDAARMKYHDAVHTAPCQQCAGKGKPAQNAIGTPLRLGHQHARALRMISKTVLEDLWEASKAIHHQREEEQHTQAKAEL